MAQAKADQPALLINPTVNSARDEEIVTKVMNLFSELQSWRNTFAGQWEEVAQLIMPNSRNTFYYGNYNWPGQKKTDRQVDATGMMALGRFAAILDSLLTPRNMIWEQITTQDRDLLRDRATRLYFEEVTRILFQQRYNAHANFSSQNLMVYTSLGAFGTGALFIDQAVDEWGNPTSQLRYKAIPLGELFIHENHQGLVDGFVRWFRLTPRQARQKWGAKIPELLEAAFEKQSQQLYNFLHYVGPRTDWEPGRIDQKGKPFVSYYVSIEGRCLLQEGGYRRIPIACSRYEQAPGEVYGRGPAMAVLPALKTLNAEKTTFLKVGHAAADPVYLTADDGLVDFNRRPGAVNPGGWSMDGHALIGTLQPGNVQITKEMMDEEKALINDAFLVTLFQVLTESPTMTATEVIERTNEKGILIAPTVGRQQSEYLGPMAEREIDLLASFPGILPPMPPALHEKRGEYHIGYTSPLARQQRAQEAAGFGRTLDLGIQVVNATQDPSHLDVFDMDTAMREIAQIQAVPERWMADPRALAAKRQQRAQAQQQQMQIQAAPAAAAMMKAQTDAAQNGGGQPQQGVPQQPPGPPGPQGPPQ